MKEFGIAQAMDKLLVVACEPIRDITAVDPSKYPHASNALAYLLGGGQVIFHDKDDVVAEIMKFIPRQAAAAQGACDVVLVPFVGGGLYAGPWRGAPGLLESFVRHIDAMLLEGVMPDGTGVPPLGGCFRKVCVVALGRP